MMYQAYPWFFDLMVWILPILTAVSWREAVKAWASHFRGDSTAKMLGFGSFGLLRNLHPVGSLACPLILALRHNFVYAWARPVGIRSNYLDHGKWDVGIVVACAILSNIVMAAVWAWFAYLSTFLSVHPNVSEFLFDVGKAGVHINILLFILHLVPLAPMDSSLVIREFFPRYIRSIYSMTDEVGQYIIFGLLLLDQAQPYIMHVYHPLHKILYAAIHVPL